MIEYRVVILGSAGVGKSSLVGQFLNGFCPARYRPTVEDIYRHLVQFPDGIFHGIEILDTAGLHQFPAMRHLNIQMGKAFVIVFAIDDLTSFNVALNLVDLVKEIKGEENIPMMLVGNKKDLPSENRVVMAAVAQSEAKARGAVYIETSAQRNGNVDIVFMRLLQIAFLTQNDTNNNNNSERMRRRLSRRLSSFLRRDSQTSNDSENNNSSENQLEKRCTIL